MKTTKEIFSKLLTDVDLLVREVSEEDNRRIDQSNFKLYVILTMYTSYESVFFWTYHF